MRVARVILLALFFVNVFASAQEQPLAAPQEAAAKQSPATVYVYRYKQFVGSALGPSVYCDEVQLARMDNGRYFAVKIDPGKHAFRSNDTQSGIELTLKPEQNYFIRVEIATGFMKGHGRLILVSPEQGQYELSSTKLKPLDANKVVDTTRVSVEELKVGTFAPATPKMTTSQAPIVPQTPSAVPANSVHTTSEVNDAIPNIADQMSLGDAGRLARQKK